MQEDWWRCLRDKKIGKGGRKLMCIFKVEDVHWLFYWNRLLLGAIDEYE